MSNKEYAEYMNTIYELGQLASDNSLKFLHEKSVDLMYTMYGMQGIQYWESKHIGRLVEKCKARRHKELEMKER